MTTAPPPFPNLDPVLHARLVEIQRNLITNANAVRRCLGLPPVVAPDKRDGERRPPY